MISHGGFASRILIAVLLSGCSNSLVGNAGDSGLVPTTDGLAPTTDGLVPATDGDVGTVACSATSDWAVEKVAMGTYNVAIALDANQAPILMGIKAETGSPPLVIVRRQAGKWAFDKVPIVTGTWESIAPLLKAEMTPSGDLRVGYMQIATDTAGAPQEIRVAKQQSTSWTSELVTSAPSGWGDAMMVRGAGGEPEFFVLRLVGGASGAPTIFHWSRQGDSYAEEEVDNIYTKIIDHAYFHATTDANGFAHLVYQKFTGADITPSINYATNKSGSFTKVPIAGIGPRPLSFGLSCATDADGNVVDALVDYRAHLDTSIEMHFSHATGDGSTFDIEPLDDEVIANMGTLPQTHMGRIFLVHAAGGLHSFWVWNGKVVWGTNRSGSWVFANLPIAGNIGSSKANKLDVAVDTSQRIHVLASVATNGDAYYATLCP